MAGKRLTKSQVVSELAEATELDKKSINRVFDGLTDIIKKQLGSRGPGEFVIPGLLKLKAVNSILSRHPSEIALFNTHIPFAVPFTHSSCARRAGLVTTDLTNPRRIMDAFIALPAGTLLPNIECSQYLEQPR